MRKRFRMAICKFRLPMTLSFLLPLLVVAPITSAELSGGAYFLNPQQPLAPPFTQSATLADHEGFRLRNILHHGTHRHPDLLRQLDIHESTSIRTLEAQDEDRPLSPEHSTALQPLHISSAPLRIERLANRNPTYIETLMTAGRQRGHPVDLPSSAWTIDTIQGPNITDRETILSLARIASNAYFLNSSSDSWYDIGHGYNYTEDFGWESDGLRGHIFADTTNSTVVMGLKGTSPAVFDGADTTTNDKINDNLFFSCCCAQGGSVLWHQVCDCKTETYTCNSTCLIKNLREKDRYYYAAQQLYHNVTALYPSSDIWLAGHSLGGAVAALLGLTYGLPVVTFEAPGDALPAARLGLPTPPGYKIGSAGGNGTVTTGGFHFGHTGDPVYMGTCSSCSIAGYAMESVCHTGMECLYDTVRDKGFHRYIGNHKIGTVIDTVLKAYEEPARCEVVRDCNDCFAWRYFEGNSSSSMSSSVSTPTGSSTASHTRTRTETCKTPGWWGCLDETTTTSGKTASSTPAASSPTSTSTCKTPGWFGCLDETTTTKSSYPTSRSQSVPRVTATATPTSSCQIPGWFGCRDPTSAASTTTATPSLTPAPSRPTAGSSETETVAPARACRHPWSFWGCKRRKD